MEAKNLIFSKFFSEGDSKAVLERVPENSRRVVFIDTAATPMLVETIRQLKGRGIDVVVRDHHDVENPRNSREQEIADMAKLVRLRRFMVGSNIHWR